MNKEPKKFLDPKNDYAFKVVFGSEGSQPEAISLLNTFLKLEGDNVIESITLSR